MKTLIERSVLLSSRKNVHFFLPRSSSSCSRIIELKRFSLLNFVEMRAALIREFGGPENIRIEQIQPPPVNERQVGPEVQKFKAGDRVWFSANKNGAQADYASIDEDFVFQLPERITFAQGATLGIAYFTAYRALFMKAYAQAGQSVLIHGASGGVGLAACQLAKVHGLRVYGTASTPEGEQMAKEHGCEVVYNHREEGYVEKIKQEVPNGFNIIIEMLANVNLCSDLQLIAPQGRIIVVGNRGTTEFDPRQCMQKEASIIGLMAFLSTPEDLQRVGERINGLLERGSIAPKVGETLQLDQLPEAHRKILEPGSRGKIVVLLSPEAEKEAQSSQTNETDQQN
ncbi:PKS-ER domain-containing protein [Aphelenchoides besseyi]|nr:PKS-ER domain-containing protein [Aphelenchoides besseyi]